MTVTTLNHRQLTALAASLAAAVSVVILHNPLEGYSNTERFEEEPGGYVWRTGRPNCPNETKEELAALERKHSERLRIVGETGNDLALRQETAGLARPSSYCQTPAAVTS